ncbi:MAG: tRNA (adenosine(37)-N6)-threonylcarbamoyltransferase complex transferase subunit TsaD [Candidatus Cloacimonadaceae bacterium]|nr:tRNA (adenosine(37)-N6)-threonylcarbamoyltransferase complex transferase subunit TsaD [Candidatus Cloacimonadaceae bacterium]
MTPELILAFESSCDDTSVAVVDTDYRVLVNLISSQPEHLEFGGVLPELASRLHLKNILYLTRQALNKAEVSLADISAIAVSINPGLIGSLIVGLAFAKSLAWSRSKPLITVNHMLSHIFANLIDDPAIKPPFLALVVSGGHTELVHFHDFIHFDVIGKTLDDAAGETFDKAAKIMGLGFPGGPIIDRLARTGNPAFVEFPRGMNRKGNFNFSYSGMKTAVLNYLYQHDKSFIEANISDLAASIQQAIIDPLIHKSITYARENQLHSILLAGGVAANSALRTQLTDKAAKYGIKCHAPSLKLCMDNAAMVAAAAIPKYLNGDFSSLSINAFSAKGTKHL